MLFARYRVNAVMHFASFIQVGKSVKVPDRYYANTGGDTFTLLQAMA